MKAGMQVALLAVLAAGCVHPSRFQNDPRAAVVGPDYLDYIQEYPRDQDTQYYYPAFGINGMTHGRDLFADVPDTVPADIQRLQTIIPPMPLLVRDTEGKGWPELERKGIPLFLPKQQ
jgi:hypothetical protein